MSLASGRCDFTTCQALKSRREPTPAGMLGGCVRPETWANVAVAAGESARPSRNRSNPAGRKEVGLRLILYAGAATTHRRETTVAWFLALQGPTHRTNESTVYQLADSANIARLQQQM